TRRPSDLLVYPDLDTDDAVGCCRLGSGVIDISAQRMQRHATFAIPLAAGDIGAVEPATHLHLETLGAQAHGIANRPLHGAPEHDSALKLLSNAFGHQARVQLRLANLVHADVRGNAHDPTHLAPQTLDILTFLANHDTRTCGMHRDLGGLGGTLDLDTADRGVRQVLLQVLARLEIGIQLVGKVA